MKKCARHACLLAGVILVLGGAAAVVWGGQHLYDLADSLGRGVTRIIEARFTSTNVPNTPPLNRTPGPPALDRTDFSRLRGYPPRLDGGLPIVIMPVPETRLVDEAWIHDTAEIMHNALHAQVLENPPDAASCILGIECGIPLRVIYCEENSTSPFRVKGELPPHSPFEHGYLITNPAIDDHGAAFEEVAVTARTCSGVVRGRLQVFAAVTVKSMELRGQLARAVQVRRCIYRMGECDGGVCSKLCGYWTSTRT